MKITKPGKQFRVKFEYPERQISKTAYNDLMDTILSSERLF